MIAEYHVNAIPSKCIHCSFRVENVNRQTPREATAN